jgi:hypothetical protein
VHQDLKIADKLQTKTKPQAGLFIFGERGLPHSKNISTPCSVGHTVICSVKWEAIHLRLAPMVLWTYLETYMSEFRVVSSWQIQHVAQ